MTHSMSHIVPVKNQLTIRGVDPETDARMRSLAKKLGISRNKAAILLMRKGAGVRLDQTGPDVVGQALDSFIGTWNEETENEVLRAISDLESVDAELWT